MSNFNIAEINLSQFKKNIKNIKNILNGKKLLNIVKADAYGHGIVEISKASDKFGADVLGVATVDEGIKIRENGVKLPIIVLFQHFKSDSNLICEYNLNPIISNDECLEHYNKYLEKNNSKLKLYIKIDTGLNRMGVKPENALDLAKKVMSYRTLILEGVSTHYAAADMNDNYSIEFTNNQIKIFNEVLNNLKSNDINVNNIHTANSAALISYKNTYFDMVRAGIILYGYTYNDIYNFSDIRPILNLKSKVCMIRNIKKGESVSYGMTFISNKDTKIALIPMGYANGISRRLSNNWEVKINNKYYPLIGKICMDMTIIDIGSDNIKVGDDVLIFGDDDKINAYSLSKKISTIPHEVLVNIGDSVKRIYKE